MNPFFSPLANTLNKNLLKFSAGRATFCPLCKEVADCAVVFVKTAPGGVFVGRPVGDHFTTPASVALDICKVRYEARVAHKVCGYEDRQ